MSYSSIHVSAPSRLHFGFYSVGQNVDRRFGGMGLVLEQPRTDVQVAPASQLEILTDAPDLAKKILEVWWTEFGDLLDIGCDDLRQLPVRLTIRCAARHSGLGSGTQIALAISTALFCFFGTAIPDPQSLSIRLGRAGRSAIGSYGFFQGGFLVDRGLSDSEKIAPLDLRLDFPTEWPVVLFIPARQTGLSGGDETQAFEVIKQTPPPIRSHMISLVRDRIVPSIVERDYDRFSENLYEFGFQSGLHFSAVQNGPFCSPLVANIVQQIRDFGIQAAGQSSWGPCVFAVARSHDQADQLVAAVQSEISNTHPDQQIQVVRTVADNNGVRVKKRVAPTTERGSMPTEPHRQLN